MIFVRANEETESEQGPSSEDLKTMGAYNDRLADAGIMLSGEGLVPSSRVGLRVAFHDGSEPSVQHGPFPANELIAGFWIWKADNVEEVIEWVKKCPMQSGMTIEVRRIAEMEDFKAMCSPEGQKNVK